MVVGVLRKVGVSDLVLGLNAAKKFADGLQTVVFGPAILAKVHHERAVSTAIY